MLATYKGNYRSFFQKINLSISRIVFIYVYAVYFTMVSISKDAVLGRKEKRKDWRKKTREDWKEEKRKGGEKGKEKGIRFGERLPHGAEGGWAPLFVCFGK